MIHVPNLKNLVKSNAEVTEAEIGTLKGHLPSWMKGGTYIRNGPAKWDLSPEFHLNHVFDGFAMISRFTIDDDKSTFTTKLLASDDLAKAVRAQKNTHLCFGTRSYPDTSKSLLSRFVSNIMPQETSDNCCTGIYRIGPDIFTGVDGSFFHQIDPITLKTKEKLDANKLFGLNVISPKPNRDPHTGDVFNVGSFVSASGVKHGVVRIPDGDKYATAKDAFKKSKIVASWPSRWSASCHYTHSFGLTKNYFVVIDQPLLAGITSIATNAVKGKCMMELFEWHAQEKNRFFLVDRASGKLLRTEYISEETFFFFHIINAYEDNSHMVVDVMAYDDTENFQSMFIDHLREDLLKETKGCRARRYIFPISDDVKQFSDDGRNLNQLESSGDSAKAIRQGNQVIVSPQILVDVTGVEGPTTNKRLLGRKYKYFYGNPSFHPQFLNCLGKFNVDNGEQKIWKGNQFEHPGEPIFVPNPNSNSLGEDDGIILSAIMDSRIDSPSFLLFLDGKSFQEIARIEFNTQFPLGVDGVFVPSTKQ